MKKIRESAYLIIASGGLLPTSTCSSLSIVNEKCMAWSIINATLGIFVLLFLHGLLNGVTSNENKEGPKSVRAIKGAERKMLLIHLIAQLGILATGLIAAAYGLDGITPAVGLATEFLMAFAIYDTCKEIASAAVPNNKFDWTIYLLEATAPGVFLPLCAKAILSMRTNLIGITIVLCAELFLIIFVATCAGRELAYAEE